MSSVSQQEQTFATRLRLEWSWELHRKATAAGIEVFRAWPPAWANWKPEWGEGNVLIGTPHDPAEVVLELSATSGAEATLKVIDTLGIDDARFIVRPTPCSKSGLSKDPRPMVLDPVSGVLTR